MRRLRIHPNTLPAVLATLPHFRIGNRIRVRAADLEAMDRAMRANVEKSS